MRYVFGECILDTQQYVLYRAGHALPLQPKVFQVLHYLLTHRDRVISKQELSEQVWPQQFISDATLEGVIKAVRRAVGDDGRRQWCIQTRRSQGYRFVAPVHITDDADGDPAVSAKPPVEAHHPIELSAALTSRRETPEVIRRQLTAICCDVVEAASLVQRLDPEELRDLIQAYRSMCQTVIERFEGVIVTGQMTDLVAYFGYPQAHEDAAYRAVRASLDIVDHLAELNRRLLHENDSRLAIRVGIHTGLVVVETQDEDGAPDPIAIGAPPYVAEQIQRLAEPDTVLMSAVTAALVQGLFVSREIAVPPELDIALPTPLIHVLRESYAHNRFDVARSRGLAPLVGRDEELGLLRQRWEQTCQGHGQGVLLYGEAGIGKSRLVEALREQVEHHARAWVVLRCTSTTQQSAFYPVISYLRQQLQWDQDEPAAPKLHTLEAMLQACGLPLHEGVPLVAPLLSVPLEGRYTPTLLPPDIQRRKTLEVLTTWLLRGTVSYPGLMVWEDIHWADPSTVALLSLLLEQIPLMPVLVLLTCRPTFQPPWPFRSYLTPLALNRLSRDHVVQMIAHAAVGTPLPDEVTQEVLNKSDGVPLFVEELMKLILEAKVVHQENGQYVLSKSLTDLAIPSTLQDLLMARLDRLGPALGVLQLGSMLGREFPYNMLQAVAPLEEAELQQGLTRLREAELLHQQGLPPHSTYLFKHALLQEAAYQSMLKRRRRQYHQRIAHVLEAQFPAIAEQQPELLARHYTEAERPSQAVAYWQKAGQAALSRLAYVEAIRHSFAGLALLATMPTTSTSLQHELVLQSTLGMAYTATKGFAASEVEQAYGRALELCQQVGDFAQLLPILGGLRTFYFARGALRTARELSEQQLGLAQRQKNSTFLIQASTNLGVVLFYLGALREAQEKLQQGRHLLRSVGTYAVLEMRDSRVNCLSHTALALLLGGAADQALACSQEALTLAQALAQPFSLAYALGMASVFHLMRREYHDTQRYAEAALALSREQGFASFVATGEIMWRFALAAQGLGENDFTPLHQAVATRRATGTEVLGVVFLLCLADTYHHVGQTEAGLSVLVEAKEMMESKEEYAFEAEWYRIRGELLLQQARPEVTQAESCFQQAIEVARRQHAKWWELRAATRLGKLWQQQEKRDEACQLLGEVYGGFTEGFATVDLREAHALLEALTG